MNLQEYFKGWSNILNIKELNKVVAIINTLYSKNDITPSYNDIFKAFHLCDRENCKIIFLGQDPYPQKGVATGVLFGNKEGTTELSPSLEVIKEAAINYEIPHPPLKFDVTLESWAKQGILMLNSALTCELYKVGSHVMLWRPFISSFLRNLSNTETGLVYVLFGQQAQTFEPYINKEFNTIIKEQHPAFYARNNKSMSHQLFVKLDKLMISKYGKPIKWYLEL